MNRAGVLRSCLTLARAEMFTRERGRWRARSGLGAVVLALAISALLTYSLTRLFVAFAADGATALESARVLAAVFSATALGTLLFDLHATMATLLLAPDLELLRRAPLPARTVLGLKLLDALPLSSTMIVALAIPTTVAFALAYPGALRAGLAPFVLAALWAIPLGLGVAVAAALVRIAPAALVRETIGLLTTLALTLTWLTNTFLLPRLLSGGRMLDGTLRSLLAQLPAPPAASPAAWAVDALIAPWPRALPALGLLAAGAALSLGLAALLGARALRRGNEAVRTTPSGRRTSRIAFTASRASAFLQRDLALYLRDWTVMSDIVVAALLWTLLPLAFVPVLPMPPAVLAHTMLVALTVGLGHEVASRALPFERDAIQWLRLAPIAPARWVISRVPAVLAIALPLYLTGWIAVTVTLRLGPGDAFSVLLQAGAALATSIALGFWVGAAFGDPAWRHPRAMLKGTGRLVAVILLVGQAAVWLALRPMLAGWPGIPATLATLLVAAGAISASIAGATRVLSRPGGQRD